ncbi:uncharacterized protein AB675_1539 [Cyphellophora attinorum]|uniref:Malate dehydrogenase n=1 Tax=Cyphellophora attinorum TaxID=1664694 RepID=A0A0N0NJQ7_9EURO|nr:uncharacterized protein AB675_1539 [Phialophora attinorum]KPI37168.1 hypothetical protein AB675_1539 [Phialophora attinorum]
MYTTILTTLLLATSALAAPHSRRQPAPPGTCDPAAISGLTQPTSTLPAPSGVLASIVVGRGVQNYTCANGTTGAPVANGAVAILYDASCVAVDDPSTFSGLTTQALTQSLPANEGDDFQCGGTALKRSGHHFFNAAKTPVFDLSESGPLGDTTTPAASDVAWLDLASTSGTTGPITAIYRIETRGGQPPASCADPSVVNGLVSVQYAAEYWVYTTAPATGTPPAPPSPPSGAPAPPSSPSEEPEEPAQPEVPEAPEDPEDDGGDDDEEDEGDEEE